MSGLNLVSTAGGDGVTMPLMDDLKTLIFSSLPAKTDGSYWCYPGLPLCGGGWQLKWRSSGGRRRSDLNFNRLEPIPGGVNIQ